MSKKELPKNYIPAEHEDRIYSLWEETGAFNPDNLEGEPYAIMMPPPNVTGVLHLGHALENSLMDIMVRFQRMRGKKTLLLPGTDHAAVATQAKVEKLLVEKGMKNPRQELGRENLLAEIRIFAEQSKSTILKQIRKMGTSCDWSRLAYTFDAERNLAVNTVFVKMFNDGLIYRGYRPVNWSVKGQSTCSDDELVHIERPAKLYTFKYDKNFPISIASTRPETKLGDTAVAVNPNDKRYKQYIGQSFMTDIGAAKPLHIIIIADENVDPNFGTGAVGVTPAHSMVDFEMYERQKAKGDPIDLVQVIGPDGRMTEAAGADYAGLEVSAAREKLVAWLREHKLMEKEEDITQNVGTSDRFGDVVEVLPMTQWFVDVNKTIPGREKSLKNLMREAVTTGLDNNPDKLTTITPDRFQKTYLNWIDNLRDWCVSRQIWWGHRVPVWYKKSKGNSAAEPEMYCGAKPPVDSNEWEQDEDTLDTWFSSALWTFSTLGWPKDTADFKTFHPTSWMQMGHEILFFWMARMILMSTYVLNDIPFKNVYIHGILRDEKGRKFSKSAGNNIDPLDVIKDYGTDALRLSLLLGITPGNDSKYYEEKIIGARNFITKLWNISRYILQLTEGAQRQVKRSKALLGGMIVTNATGQVHTSADSWIMKKMRNLILEVTNDFESFNFSQAGEKLREFTWNDLADWYLEASKFEKNQEDKKRNLQIILEDLLKLWHPFIPFVTETIWREMEKGSLLIVENWPNEADYAGYGEEKDEKMSFELVKEIITAIRNARVENRIEPAKKIKAVIAAGKNKKLLDQNSEIIKGLRTGINELEILEKGPKLENEIHLAVGDIDVYLVGAIDREKEQERIAKEIERLRKLVASQKSKLANEEFVSKAPKEVVNKEKEKLETWQSELSKLEK